MFLPRPWWVNLLTLVPVTAYLILRNRKLSVDKKALIAAGAFGIAFGFVEAAVVIYLRSASGLLPGLYGVPLQATSHSGGVQPPMQIVGSLPGSLITVEKLREIATIVMLVSLATLGAKNPAGRIALFLWTFATWDIAYYAGLWVMIRWPTSLHEIDVLFLIPVPWVSEVWFPLVVSALTLTAVIVARKPADHYATDEGRKISCL